MENLSVKKIGNYTTPAATHEGLYAGETLNAIELSDDDMDNFFIEASKL